MTLVKHITSHPLLFLTYNCVTQLLLIRMHRWRVIVVCVCVYLSVCLSVQLDFRDCLIWRQFEHSDGKASSSSAKDMCGFLKNFPFVELWLCKVSSSSAILKNCSVFTESAENTDNHNFFFLSAMKLIVCTSLKGVFSIL